MFILESFYVGHSSYLNQTQLNNQGSGLVILFRTQYSYLSETQLNNQGRRTKVKNTSPLKISIEFNTVIEMF